MTKSRDFSRLRSAQAKASAAEDDAGKSPKKRAPKGDEETETNANQDEDEDDIMSDDTKKTSAEIAAEAKAAERQRTADVHASEHYAGNEATANKMLADTDMSADAIAGVLATIKKPKASAGDDKAAAAAAKKAADEAAKKQMAEHIEGEGNAEVGDEGVETGASDKKGLVKAAMAKVKADRKRAAAA